MTRAEGLEPGAVRIQLLYQMQEFDEAYDGTDDVDALGADHSRATLNINIGFQVSKNVRIDATIPHHTIETEAPISPMPGPVKAEQSGMGDIAVSILWSPWGDEDHKEEDGLLGDLLHHQHLSILFGLKLPTGDENPDAFKQRAAEFRSLGTGTLDLILGATYYANLAENVRLFESLIWTIPTGKNSQQPPGNPEFTGVRFGDHIFNRLGVAWSPLDSLSLFVSLDFQWRDKDVDSPQRNQSGGTFAWATPGLSYEIGDNIIAIEIFAQIPVYYNANGERQLVGGTQWNIGVNRTF